VQEKVIVRAATERDHPGITRVQRACPEAAQWPIGDYSELSVYVAEIQSRVIGFCIWHQPAQDEAELLNLAVDPAYRRHGVASKLLRTLLHRVAGTVFLEVAENNPGAIALYRGLGWEAIATRRGYYEMGKINAVVMKKSSW
jgi:[ribosomal protein S18]-alanine N-acetyltransferase